MDVTKRKIKVSQSSKKVSGDLQQVDTVKLFLRVLEILNRPMDIVFLDEAGFDNF